MRSSALVVSFLLTCIGCGSRNDALRTAQVTTGGDPGRGAAAIGRYGCGTCHVIPGISGAVGKVGPPLTGIGDRVYLAGELQNTPDNMMRWIKNPQAINPKTVMPNVGATDSDVRDIAGYLYTLR
ncbi:MAG: c-type cytochrome [Bryobacteraceae bacterium]